MMGFKKDSNVSLRKIPETKEEWEEIKAEFILSCPDIEDSPETWTFILSQLQGVKMPELFFDYNVIYAYYKRWKIAKLLQDEKAVYIQELEVKLKDKFEALAKLQAEEQALNGNGSSPELPSGTQDIRSSLQGVSEDEAGMVPAS